MVVVIDKKARKKGPIRCWEPGRSLVSMKDALFKLHPLPGGSKFVG
ncbi:MAG: hypothetical protein RIS44_2478 [Pseudomonadota bacterium]